MAGVAQNLDSVARASSPVIQGLIERLLFTRLSQRHRPVHCLQIGANDGRRDDPVHAYVKGFGWRCLMVEPVPYLYERLLETYRGVEGVRCVNCAISTSGETLPFYYLPPRDDQQAWYESLGSFRKEVVLSHRKSIPDIESRIAETEVRCLSLEDLLEQEQVTKIDLLVVDTEGYDAEIIRALDFREYRPSMVYFEHKHLGNDERQALRRLFEAQGLDLLELLHNTIALDKSLAPPEDQAFLRDCYREALNQTMLLSSVAKMLQEEGVFKVTKQGGNTVVERV